ncbi:MAG TPA: L-threonylcarbamoyladenylate synthase [Gaiellaceae bacterium]|nr:L-threonylcarbamoyladenylate synthase [Gaiellaceae bacterium]
MIAPVVEAIRAGEPVILPTDTVYGLCADAFREEAVQGLYRLKGRGKAQPIALLAASEDVVADAVPELAGRPLLRGPYTLILPNPAGRLHWLTGDRPETIGVRIPALEGEARAVLDEVGAVAATSANLPGGDDPRRLENVPRELREGCAAELDGGELPGMPSTVVDLTGPEPVIVREGAVAIAEALEQVSSA